MPQAAVSAKHSSPHNTSCQMGTTVSIPGRVTRHKPEAGRSGQVNPAKCSADLARIAGLGRVGLRVASVRDSGSPRPVNVWEALEPFDPSGEAGAGEAVWEVASGNSVAVGIAARAAETQMRVSLPEARAPLSCVRTPARRGVLVFVDACSRCQVYLALALCWTALVLYRRS
jgi:hypothetical protein